MDARESRERALEDAERAARRRREHQSTEKFLEGREEPHAYVNATRKPTQPTRRPPTARCRGDHGNIERVLQSRRARR